MTLGLDRDKRLGHEQLEMCRCDTDAPAGIAKLEYGTC